MYGTYTGRTVAVTGARKGIGRALARHFLDQGAHVFDLSRLPGGLQHPHYEYVPCDVRNAKSVRGAFAQVRMSSPRLDILINNAGVLTNQHSIMMTGEAAEDMLLTNLLGTLLASREAAKIMIRTKSGRIINIGSMAAVLEPIGDSVYAACKAGLTSMTAVLAKEFGPFGITCNTVGVTAFSTDMSDQITRTTLSRVIDGLPLPRFAKEDDIANVVDFFASERSAYVTAQTLYLGGLHA